MEVDYIALGKRIAAKRHQLRLTQLELCEMAEISETYISIIECGKSKTSLQVLSNIANVLDTTLDHLVLGNPDIRIKLEADELYQDILQLTNEKTKYVKAFLTAIKSE